MSMQTDLLPLPTTSAAPVLEAVLLKAERVGRRADGRDIVGDASLEVRSRETVALVGASGSGKSSFLRLLNRLDEPTSGTVYLDGVDYRRLDPRELRRRIGLLLQASWLFPGTVADNVRFGPASRGDRLDDAELESLLRRVDLQGYGDRSVERLSGGEAQRVALARTLANAPEVLLLDEPTSALDEAARDHVESLLHDVVAERRLACVLVTHDPGQARRLADRAAVMDHGRIVRAGRAREVV
jgi:ABC-type sulfate/molybdate transport systems ATPase subunit